MAKQRCSKHPFYYEPCSICMEINKLEEDVLNRNAKTIELEESLHCVVVEKVELEECLATQDKKILELEDLVKEQREEISDVRRVRIHAEESARKYAEQTCELQAEIESLSAELEKTMNLAYKSYNPEAKLKLSVNDLLVVRGIFVANSFLFNSLHNIDQCIMQKKDKTTQEQLILIKKDLEKEWQRVVDLLKVFAKEFSDSNWNRMIRETQKIVELAVNTMNSRELGHFTVGKNDELDIDYKIRPLVVKAVNNCINSAGTNNLTAYSRELLVKDLVRIVEEK